jgi:hypothetical protein
VVRRNRLPGELMTNDIRMFLPLVFSRNANNQKRMQC